MASKGKSANVFRRWHQLTKAVCAAATVAFLIVAGGAARCSADTLCVNKTGSGGCYSTIQGAINKASTDTTIVVAPGRYTATCNGPACSVASIVGFTGLKLICRPVTGRSVVLNASGLDHAIWIYQSSGVTVQGCVAKNAAREGILVEDSDNITIRNNDVADNDQNLSHTSPCPSPHPTTPVCCPDAYPSGPGNFPDDNDDCGEGLHLRSVTNSVVQDNYVHNNVGGILLTDELSVTKNNLIRGNISEDNIGDCGITLASHVECGSGSSDASGCVAGDANAGYGVIDNSVIGNQSIGNGGAGVGAFANPGAPTNGGAATNASGNLISENVLKDNGLPGVAIHVHAENGMANNNTVIENVISGNQGDAEATPLRTGIEVLSNGSFGPPFSPASPILGTTIARNKVSNEHIDVWVGNTATDANVFLNNLKGAGKVGVQNGGTGTITATDNWWGCPQGPGISACSDVVPGSGTIISTPFLNHAISPER